MPRFSPHPERRTAVVTGASSGIGRATAIALAAAGHPVVLGARRVDRCTEVAEEIRAGGGEAIAVHLDLHEPDSVESFASAAESELGPVEIVVSNAGDVRPITTVGADGEEFLRQISVNLLGPQRLVHHLAPAMIERGRGDIVFVTSEVALSPRPHMAAYVASKTGLEGMAHAMRMELEGTGVRVGIVRPGPSATEQGSTWDPDSVDAAIGAWKHWGLLRHDGYLRPADVAGAVMAMVTVPPGTHFTVLEVQPEAPPRRRPTPSTDSPAAEMEQP